MVLLESSLEWRGPLQHQSPTPNLQYISAGYASVVPPVVTSGARCEWQWEREDAPRGKRGEGTGEEKGAKCGLAFEDNLGVSKYSVEGRAIGFVVGFSTAATFGTLSRLGR